MRTTSFFGFGALVFALGCGDAGSTAATPGTGDASTGADSSTGGDGSAGDGSTSGCGTCPTGSTCGSANGIAVCRAASGIPLFKNVFVIVMENTSKKTLDAATNTPYLKALAQSAAIGSDYHGVAHPSLPNYVAMMSGDTQGISCDCDPTGNACTGLTCNALLHGCGCSHAAASIADQLEAAGKTWKSYAEGMGTPCNKTSAGAYATRHVPFLYYDGVQTSAARCASHVVDYAALAGDMGAPPSLAFIAPNLTNDMHDPFPANATNFANGDAWLSTHAKAILESAAYKAGGLLVIVWDEDDNSGIPAADDPVPIFVMSPYAKTGYASATKADHYSLLATIEDGLGVGRLGKAAQATPLADYFPAK